MNQTRIIFSGDGMQGSSHNNRVQFQTPSTINNRRQLLRNAHVKALNWEELFLHFQEVTQICKPSTYIEEIRTDVKLNNEYKKKISKKVLSAAQATSSYTSPSDRGYCRTHKQEEDTTPPSILRRVSLLD